MDALIEIGRIFALTRVNYYLFTVPSVPVIRS